MNAPGPCFEVNLSIRWALPLPFNARRSYPWCHVRLDLRVQSDHLEANHCQKVLCMQEVDSPHTVRSSKMTWSTISFCERCCVKAYHEVDCLRLTNCTYWPNDPNAIPFPPRHVMFLAMTFVDFWKQNQIIDKLCIYWNLERTPLIAKQSSPQVIFICHTNVVSMDYRPAQNLTYVPVEKCNIVRSVGIDPCTAISYGDLVDLPSDIPSVFGTML